MLVIPTHTHYLMFIDQYLEWHGNALLIDI